MAQLWSGFSTLGSTCPKCKNGSFFKENRYRYLLIYVKTINRCHVCNHKTEENLSKPV